MNHSVWWLLAGGITICTGCATRHPLERWQAQVEPAVLRDNGPDASLWRYQAMARPDAARPGRIVIWETVSGASDQGRGDDVAGVLVGYAPLPGAVAPCFLVGVVERDRGRPGRDDARSELDELHLAVAAKRGGGVEWAWSESSRGDVQRYLKDAGGFGPAPFPQPFDRYELSVQGDRIVLIERRSGVTWSVPRP